MDLVKSASSDGVLVNQSSRGLRDSGGLLVELELLRIRRGGALGSGALTYGETGLAAEVCNGAEVVPRAATLPTRRGLNFTEKSIRCLIKREASVGGLCSSSLETRRLNARSTEDGPGRLVGAAGKSAAVTGSRWGAAVGISGSGNFEVSGLQPSPAFLPGFPPPLPPLSPFLPFAFLPLPPFTPFGLQLSALCPVLLHLLHAW